MLTRRSLLPLLAAPLGAANESAPRFVRRFLYERDKTEADFFHFQFLSDKTGFLCGNYTVKNEKPKGLLLITRDGGAKWTPQDLEFIPISFFALDDSLLWCVSANEELWHSTEGGRDWRKVAKKKRARSVRFFDDKIGILLGTEKLMLRTTDSGKTWMPIPEIDLTGGSVERFAFTAAEVWGNKLAVVAGRSGDSMRRLFRSHPDWIEPDVAARTPSLPSMTVVLDSVNAGAKWRTSTVSAFGSVNRIRIGADGTGLILVQFDPAFTYGGELYSFLPLKDGVMAQLFRPMDMILHDAVQVPGKGYYVGCTQRTGKLTLPIPAKVRVQFSTDGKVFTDIPVDYRAVAESVLMASTPSGEVWLATDEGMLLSLR